MMIIINLSMIIYDDFFLVFRFSLNFLVNSINSHHFQFICIIKEKNNHKSQSHFLKWKFVIIIIIITNKQETIHFHYEKIKSKIKLHLKLKIDKPSLNDDDDSMEMIQSNLSDCCFSPFQIQKLLLLKKKICFSRFNFLPMFFPWYADACLSFRLKISWILARFSKQAKRFLRLQLDQYVIWLSEWWWS